jgi:hypothetical protein
MRKKDEDAERKARRIADEAALALRNFEAYRREAARLHMEAEERGIKDVKFMGTQRGVLAVEEAPGAPKLAMARCDWPGGATLKEMIETEGYSKSPEMLAVIPKESNLGGCPSPSAKMAYFPVKFPVCRESAQETGASSTALPVWESCSNCDIPIHDISVR